MANAQTESVRVDAALRLGGFGARSKAEVDTLIDARRDSSRRVRQESITALGMIGPSAAASIPALTKIAAGKVKAAAARARSALRSIRAK